MAETKSINATFTESTHEQLSQVKGRRSWAEAIVEEFGVDDDE